MRILVVEDEKKLAEMVARGLKAERYAIDIAPRRRIRLADGQHL